MRGLANAKAGNERLAHQGRFCTVFPRQELSNSRVSKFLAQACDFTDGANTPWDLNQTASIRNNVSGSGVNASEVNGHGYNSYDKENLGDSIYRCVLLNYCNGGRLKDYLRYRVLEYGIESEFFYLDITPSRGAIS